MKDRSTAFLDILRRAHPGGWLLAAALVLIFGPMLAANMRIDSQPWRINDDVLQQIPPFYRDQPEPALANDYLFTYYLDCFPLGFRAIYSGAAKWLGDPRPLSKVLPYFLLAVFLALMGFCAWRLGGWPLLIALLLVMLSANLYLGRMSGGLPRAFGYVTTALALAGLVTGRWQVVLAAIALGAAFYPATGFFAGICLGLLLITTPKPFWQVGKRELIRRGGILAAGALTGLILLLPVMQGSRGYGPVLTAADAAEFPEIGPGGRYLSVDRELPPLEALRQLGNVAAASLIGEDDVDATVSPFYTTMTGRPPWLGGFRLIDPFIIVFVILAAIGGFRRWRTGDLAYRRLFLGVAALAVALGLALAVTPYLYLPFRYIRYCWGPLFLLLLFAGLQGLRSLRREPCPWSPAEWRRFFTSPALLASASLFLLVGSLGGWQERIDASPNLPALTFLREHPADGGQGRVAGWPTGTVELVPYYSRQPVLLNQEVHQIFHRDYVEELRRRMNLLVQAYALSSTEALRQLHDDYQVRYLLFDTADLRSATPQPLSYFQPFQDQLRQISAEGRLNLLSQHIAHCPEAIAFQNDHDTIVDLRVLLQQVTLLKKP